MEDDPAYADRYRLKLELEGYTVQLASDGRQALQMLQSGMLPDVMRESLELGALDCVVKANVTPSELSQGIQRWAPPPRA